MKIKNKHELATAFTFNNMSSRLRAMKLYNVHEQADSLENKPQAQVSDGYYLEQQVCQQPCK